MVIDANIISKYYKELIVDEGELYNLINCIFNDFGIAVSDLILHEWNSTCKNDILSSWITDGIKLGKIKYVDPSLDRNIIKKLHINYGLPKKNNGKTSRDIEYIKCANVTSIKYILTYDIDFFDPRLKTAHERTKKNAKENRTGRLCRFLEKELNIIVGLPSHCISDLNISE